MAPAHYIIPGGGQSVMTALREALSEERIIFPRTSQAFFRSLISHHLSLGHLPAWSSVAHCGLYPSQAR